MKNLLSSKIGIKLELEFVNSIGEKIGQSYVSQLIDVFDDKNIAIAAPIHESRLMLITPGTKIRCIFLDERQGLLSFLGAITKRERRESLTYFNAEITGDFEKIQRRNYFRLDCLLNATYILLNEETDESNASDAAPIPGKKALTRNISGNGARIVIDEKIPKGSSIQVKLWLTKEVVINVTAKVVRCTQIEGIRDTKYEVGLYFTKLTQREQDILVKYIFDQQRLQLKNNLSDR